MESYMQFTIPTLTQKTNQPNLSFHIKTKSSDTVLTPNHEGNFPLSIPNLNTTSLITTCNESIKMTCQKQKTTQERYQVLH